MNKKVWIGLLGLLVLLALPVSSIPVHAKDVADYTDVSQDAWFYEYIKDVSDKEIMTGLDTDVFGVEENLKRGQFATVLYRIAGRPSTSFRQKFVDVPDDQFFSIPVSWANKEGIITGYGGGLFGPDDNITREQLVTMLYRYALIKGYDVAEPGDFTAYPDGDDVSSFAVSGMKWALGKGMITGDQGMINPGGYVNRAVCATIISRFCKMLRNDDAHVHIYNIPVRVYYHEKGHEEERIIVPEAGHYEDRGKMEAICDGCGRVITTDPWGHCQAEVNAGNTECSNYHEEWISNYIWVVDIPAVTQKIWVMDVPGNSEIVGYQCICGARR